MKIFSVKLWRRFLVAMATVLAIMIALTNIANSQAPALNNFFDCQTFKIEKGEDSGVDTEYFKSAFSDTEELEEFLDATCRDVEAEGIVLLRNDNALPLAKGSKISLFGQGSTNFNYGSTGSSANADTSEYPSLKDALTDFSVNGTLWDFYLNGAASRYKRTMVNLVYKVNEAPWSIYTDAVKNSFAQYGDAAVYVISRDSGEGQDISTTGSDGLDGSYLSITAQEQEVLRQLTLLKNSGTFGKIIVILNSAVPIQLDFMFDDTIDIDAAMWVGNVGSTGIYAINDVLCGTVNPSGKLSDTYCKDNFSSPAMANWASNPNKKFSQTYSNASAYSKFDNTQNVYGVYVEGIYVGYRYYETRYADAVMGSEGVGDYDYSDDVAFPFGYGLSYTDFMYSNAVLEEKDDSFVYSVDVMNIGDVPGKAVVQVYLQKPYNDYDKQYGIEKAAVELAGFEKTEELGLLESVTVSVEIDKSQLRSYDANNAKTYILSEGDYFFSAGDNAHDALNNILAARGFTVEEQSDSSLCKSWNNPRLDAESFAYSTENKGTKITNQFDFCDMNRYDGKGNNSVTYVSRSNWEGTWPDEPVTFSISDKMAKDIASYKEIEEDGSSMPEYGQNNGITLAMLRSTEGNPIAYDDPAWESLLDQMTYEDQAYLITNGQHTTVELGEPVNKPATKDENGPNGVEGSVTNTSFPSEGIWASTFNKELIKKVGECLGEDALASGVTGLYAPGVNIHRVPFGGRAHEYFSEDPYLSAIASVEEVKGMQSKGVWPYVKHFAANDEETNRNGIGIWLNEQEMREIILLPFEYSFKPSQGNAHATMTSFNRIGCLWTSASSNLMENVLRGEWVFDGFAITDMAASNAQSFMTFVDGIMNGTDCYDGPGSRTALNDYRSSPAFANKMREAAHRILYVTANYSAAMNGIAATDRIVPVATWWEITLITVIVVFAVATAGSAAMLGLSYYKNRKNK